MNSQEKFDKMLSMEPYNDRTEMPVFPMMITTYGALTGMTQAKTMESPDNWLKAMTDAWKIVGKPDVAMPMCPLDTTFTMGLPARLPGRELGENELYQFVEKPFFDDTSEYQKIMQMGWQNWQGMYLCRVQTPPFTSPDQLMARFGRMGQNLGKTMGFIMSQGVVPIFHTATAPIFDTLSMARSMEEFIYDLFDDPGPIMDVLTTYQPQADEGTIRMAKANHATRIGMFAMRSSATFLSPDMFEEYVWPVFKPMVERYHAAGMTVILHADGNWLPMLEYFTQLPKGSMHIELDGSTDIEKAYDILRGSQTIRGDVPATMLMMAEPDEVSAYCDKLIRMGMKGGFMLGSGCEIPMNAKPENIKAMIDSVR